LKKWEGGTPNYVRHTPGPPKCPPPRIELRVICDQFARPGKRSGINGLGEGDRPPGLSVTPPALRSCPNCRCPFALSRIARTCFRHTQKHTMPFPCPFLCPSLRALRGRCRAPGLLGAVRCRCLGWCRGPRDGAGGVNHLSRPFLELSLAVAA